MADRIEKATDLDFVRYYRVEPLKTEWVAWALKNGRYVKALAGVAKSDDGRFFAFMDFGNTKKRKFVFRTFKINMKKVIEEYNLSELFVICDTAVNRAEAFLERLGFVKTEETIEEQAVWKWQR